MLVIAYAVAYANHMRRVCGVAALGACRHIPFTVFENAAIHTPPFVQFFLAVALALRLCDLGRCVWFVNIQYANACAAYVTCGATTMDPISFVVCEARDVRGTCG